MARPAVPQRVSAPSRPRAVADRPGAVAGPRAAGSDARVHRGALAASALIHALLAAGVLTLASGAARERVIEVRWQPSEASVQSVAAPPVLEVVVAAEPPPPTTTVAEAMPPPDLAPSREAAVEAPPQPFADEPDPRVPAHVAPLAAAAPPTPQWLDALRVRDAEPVAQRTAEASAVDATAAPAATAVAAPASDWVPAEPDVDANRPPVYPKESRRHAEQGTVLVELHISERGDVTDARLLRSSGHPRLDRAALRALREWRYAPARRHGTAEPTRIEQPVHFRLQG